MNNNAPSNSLLHNIFLGALLVLSPLATNTALAQALFSCDLLIGAWAGEHRDVMGNYARWIADYSDDDRLRLEFFDDRGTLLSVQEGQWQCQGTTLFTTLSAQGEKLEFTYQILSLDESNFSYRSEYDGTVFQSTKTN